MDIEIFEILERADAIAAHPVLVSMYEEGDDPAATLDEYLISLQQAQENGYVFLGCRKDGKIIGTSGIRIMPDPWGAQPYAILNNLVILPDYRNQGIGTRLLQYSQQLAQQRGAHGVGLHVRAHNDKAIKLYESMGFKNNSLLMWRNF